MGQHTHLHVSEQGQKRPLHKERDFSTISGMDTLEASMENDVTKPTRRAGHLIPDVALNNSKDCCDLKRPLCTLST